MNPRPAFTIIEMVVVLAIISLLSGMAFALPKESDANRVQRAAGELRGVLLTARSLAMRNRETYAVTFHIENTGNGHVLRNRSDASGREAVGSTTGGHWYAIIGPDKSPNSNNQAHPPILDRDFSNITRAKQYRTILGYAEGMREAMIGKRHYLPRGVRFLALADEDLGTHRTNVNHGSTYPRPWYGHFEGGRLYAWGGYDADIDADSTLGGTGSNHSPFTGFGYAGGDGPIPYDATRDAKVHPATVFGRFADMRQPRCPGDSAGSLPAETSLAGEARPVLDGLWGDYMILFNPDGSAHVSTFYARRRFLDQEIYNEVNIDRYRYRGQGRIGNRDALTGGFHLTLARDIDSTDPAYTSTDANTGGKAYHLFNSPEDALRSLMPFRRVFVGAATGQVQIREPNHPHCRITAADLGSHDPYPHP